MEKRKITTTCLMLGIILILQLDKVCSDGFMGIPGRYCVDRGSDCCASRDDDCGVEIMGTRCYCDDFCDRREGGDIPDCCPDFYEHCRHEPPAVTTTEQPAIVEGCWNDGTFYPLDARIKRNCNECSCRKIWREEELYEFICDNNVCLVENDLIERINANPDYYRWTAGNYSFLYGLTMDEGYKYRLGTFKPEGFVTRMHEIRIDKNAILPDRFDTRERWPGFIHEIRDQGNCAASWAFSTSELASDRIAIMTKGEVNTVLSPQHLLSCNRHAQKGCQGGHIDRAWWFLRKKGISSDQCYPYAGEQAVAEKCQIATIDLTAVLQCPTGSSDTRLFEVTPPYRLAQKENEIKYEIFSNGPVQAVFHVAPDFFSYKSGIYRSSGILNYRNDDGQSTYHSVRIIGWGTETSNSGFPVHYWLCTNSWGKEWGEDGMFRIVRGENEAEIESFVVGVWGQRSGGYLLNPPRQRRRPRHHHSKEKTDRSLV